MDGVYPRAIQADMIIEPGEDSASEGSSQAAVPPSRAHRGSQQALAAGCGDADSGTDTDDEGLLIKQAATLQQQFKKVDARPPRAPGQKSAPRRPAGSITLKTLVDAGYLTPGEEVLYVEYKNVTTHADLTQDGHIKCKGMVFESPSAFSIFLKRQVNPNRKADDGWKAVKYAGKFLEYYKNEYLRNRSTARSPQSDATPTSSMNPAAAASSPASGLKPSTSGGESPAEPSSNAVQSADSANEEQPAKRRRMASGGIFLNDHSNTSISHNQQQQQQLTILHSQQQQALMPSSACHNQQQQRQQQQQQPQQPQQDWIALGRQQLHPPQPQQPALLPGSSIPVPAGASYFVPLESTGIHCSLPTASLPMGPDSFCMAYTPATAAPAAACSGANACACCCGLSG